MSYIRRPHLEFSISGSKMQCSAAHAVEEEFGAMIDKPRDQVRVSRDQANHVTRWACPLAAARCRGVTPSKSRSLMRDLNSDCDS